jgi:hypothetical protein
VASRALPSRARPCLGVVLLGTGVISGVIATHLADGTLTQPGQGVAAWLAGGIAFLMGAAVLDGAPRRVGVAWPDVAVVSALTAVAVLARVVSLDTIPRSFSGDEGEMREVARAVLRGELVDPFATGWLSHPTLWFFLQAGSLRAFGDDVVGLRMLSALIGAATVAALYVFARSTYGRGPAIVAAALLAVYHLHVHYSRIGLNNVADALPALVAFTALLHGIRRGSWLGFAGAGAALGLSMYFYMGARLVPIVAAIALAHLLLVDRRRFRELAARIALVPVGFALVAGPLIHWFAEHPDALDARLKLVGLVQSGAFEERQGAGESALGILGAQFRRAAGAYTSVPDRTTFYDPGTPLLDAISATLFVIGLIVLVVAWRRSESAVLASWLLGAGLLGGMLLVDPPQSTRYVNAAPAVCLVVALGLVSVVRFLGRSADLSSRTQHVVVVTTVMGLALWNLDFYFRDYTPRAKLGGPRTELQTAVARSIADRPDETYVYLLAGRDEMYLNNGTIRFIAPGRNGLDVLPTTSGADLPLVTVPHMYVFTPGRFGEIEAIEAREPGGSLGLQRSDVDDRPLFATYEPS